MTVSTKQPPGAVLKAAREAKLMTLRELAQACTDAGESVDHSHLSRLERGEFVARPKLRAALAQVLELDPELLK
jgi:transcriptional regulator with XRE-family HTH domain